MHEQLVNEVIDKDLIIEALITKNEEEIGEHERQTREFRQ